jgi:CBS domain-containing protein
MTQRLQTISPSDSVEELKQLTAAKGIHHLLVTDAEARLLGIISDRDLLGRPGQIAADVMTANPLTVTPDTPVSAALTLLVRRRISCLPVVEGERACGIITTTDVILALQCIIQTLERVGAVTQGMVQEDLEVRYSAEAAVAGTAN